MIFNNKLTCSAFLSGVYPGFICGLSNLILGFTRALLYRFCSHSYIYAFLPLSYICFTPALLYRLFFRSLIYALFPLSYMGFSSALLYRLFFRSLKLDIACDLTNFYLVVVIFVKNHQ